MFTSATMGISTNQFFEHLGKSHPVNLSKLTPEELKEAGEANWNTIFNLEGPRSIKRKPLACEVWYSQRLFKPFSSIFKSHETLQDIEVYVRRFPFRGTRVSPATYLRHNIEVYLQEVYILRQRMIDFLNYLEKDYAKSSQGVSLKNINAPFCREIKKRLKPIIKARVNHVHGWGYDDKRLSRLDTLELLANYNSRSKMRHSKKFKVVHRILYEDAYKEERKRWSKLLHQWNETIGKLLDEYFNGIDCIVFPLDGKPVFPPLSTK